ncbi:unnamed protein product [Rhizoctonia solani]|uniref:PCI domain-containing protein n=1 Tax=Rhizoctonia solani TaxID=456999 RepID=A0A8H3GU05_9AGAM|nr:unnamed protein product [Rhizoctonia solani]
MAKSAKGAAATKLIADATSAPGTYAFAELLEMPNIRELAANEQHTQWLDLLKLFSYRTWTDYKQLSGSLPQLNPAQATKLKQLSIVSLAERSRILAYPDLLACLDISSVRQLEDLIIDAMYQDVLKGKLDQKEARIEIEYTIGRDLEPDNVGLEVLLGKLRDWSSRTATVIQALDDQIQGIKDNEKAMADAAREHERERVTMATQAAEQRRQQPRKQVVEDAMAGNNAPSGSSADVQRPAGARKGAAGDFQNADRWCFNLDLGEAIAQTNIFMPALLFSKIVPGYTAQNIVALGPLILVACIYQLYGFVIAWITRKIFWVPRCFHSGILAAGIWSNWGDLPTAVIMSMTASAPFSPGDSDVAVAYLSAFILVFFVTLFPFGGSRIIEKDYLDKSAPVDAEDEIPESASSRLHRRWERLQVAIRSQRGAVTSSDVEKSPTTEEDEKVSGIATPQPKLSPHVSFNPSEPTAYNGLEGGHSTRPPSAHVSPAPTVVEGILTAMSPNPKDAPKTVSVPTEAEPGSTTKVAPSRLQRTLLSIRAFLRSLASPATITMVVSFVVALVPQLKALFIIPPAGSNIHIHPAPDGLPPLNIIMDTATFIGNASVPLGLICLGSALARLEAPKPISRAPLGAITMFSILKMVLSPVFGVLVVEALTHHTSLIDPNDKVLRFVCIYFAGVPTATTQVYLTQIYSPDGSASHISAFLIPQYALMFVTMTALSAYALSILF